MSVLLGRAGSTIVGGGGSSSSGAAAATRGSGVTGLAADPGRAAARRRRSARRTLTSRVTAAYEVWVTSSAPTGTAVSSNSHAPALPIVVCSATAAAQPVRPPACTTPPRVTRAAASESVDCCSSPVAARSSRSRPATGTQPRAASGRTNAAAPQTKAASGNKNAAYPNARKNDQATQIPTGPTIVVCSAGKMVGSNTASATRTKTPAVSAAIPCTSRTHRRGGAFLRVRRRGGDDTSGGRTSDFTSVVDTLPGIRPPE